MFEEDGNANENKVENLDDTLEEEVQTETDFHLECRAAGQECGRVDGVWGLARRKVLLVDLVNILGKKSEREHLKTARLSVKINIQNEALENIEDLELATKGKKMKRIAKSSILVAAKKRKVDASFGQFFSSNGNEIQDNANKVAKTEVNRQTETEVQKETKCGTNTKTQKRRVAWTRSATRVSVGGSEEKVRTALKEGTSRHHFHLRARISSINQTGF